MEVGMGVFTFIILAGVAYFIYSNISETGKEKRRRFVCTKCGFLGYVPCKRAGSAGITIVLFCFFIIPGLIYSSWRWSARKRMCPQCKSQDVIPGNSPFAKKILERNV
jgi:hypothetical protein